MVSASPQRARLQASVAGACSLVLWWKLGGIIPAIVAGFACSLALLAWVSPGHFAPIQRTLDRVLQALLAGLTWLLLAMIYFGVFTPLRGWRALTRRDALALRPNSTANTYMRPLPPAAPGRFDRQF